MEYQGVGSACGGQASDSGDVCVYVLLCTERLRRRIPRLAVSAHKVSSSSPSLHELPLPLLPSSLFFFYFPTSAPLGSGGVLKISVLPFDDLIGIFRSLFVSLSASEGDKSLWRN